MFLVLYTLITAYDFILLYNTTIHGGIRGIAHTLIFKIYFEQPPSPGALCLQGLQNLVNFFLKSRSGKML